MKIISRERRKAKSNFAQKQPKLGLEEEDSNAIPDVESVSVDLLFKEQDIAADTDTDEMELQQTPFNSAMNFWKTRDRQSQSST